MDPIEKAIRNALEKGDTGDRVFREKVYRSAFSALDRALQANPNVTVETAINRRKAMQAKIAEIEAEFLPAPVRADPAFAPESEAGEADIDAMVQPPLTDPEPAHAAPAGYREPVLDMATGEDASPLAEQILPEVPDIMPDAPLPRTAAEPQPDLAPKRRRPRRRSLPAIFTGLTLLAVIALGAWWLLQSGALRTPEERGEVPVPPASVEDEDFSPSGAAGPLRTSEAQLPEEWISVFTPRDPTTISTPADASAEVKEDDSGTFLRVRSGSSGSAVSFDVGQGILDEMSGKRAVFVLAARAEDGKETQISIDCNFGELGDCGRKRYAVTRERGEYLFDVQLPDKPAGAAGTIAINSDVDNKGKAIDIYEIKVSVENK